MSAKPNRVFIIAEAGVNHNGSLAMAKRLVDAAVRAEADAVKFQTFHTEEVVTAAAKTAGYQRRNLRSFLTQRRLIKKLELDEMAHKTLFKYCLKMKIEFLSTPFDLGSVDLLSRLGVRRLKISSGDLTNGPLLLKVSSTDLPVILSTGMASLGEIQEALGVLAFGYLRMANGSRPGRANFRKARHSARGRYLLKNKVTLLQCTTEYPAPFKDANLLVMNALRSRFGLAAGFSDHTPGFYAAVAAAACKASVIEKHLTLSRRLPGPDHAASLEPGEFKEMVLAIRCVEQCLGASAKRPVACEIKNIPAARKSLVAVRPIQKGEPFNEANLGVKRPGTGLSPMNYFEYLGRPAARGYKQDELI